MIWEPDSEIKCYEKLYGRLVKLVPHYYNADGTVRASRTLQMRLWGEPHIPCCAHPSITPLISEKFSS